MANLSKDGLSFEFRYKELDESLWIQYEFVFAWEGKSVFRDDLLKRSHGSWAKCSHGALKANDSARSNLPEVIRKVLVQHRSQWWEPDEPDMMIGFFPNQDYPFQPLASQRPTHVHSSDTAEAEMDKALTMMGFGLGEYDLAERTGQIDRPEANLDDILPDDPVSMIIFVDAYNWQGARSYQSQGFCLCMCPTFQELGSFYRDLKGEWEAFIVDQKLQERLSEP